jgi:beta-N-acetylhexosaminidase
MFNCFSRASARAGVVVALAAVGLAGCAAPAAGPSGSRASGASATATPAPTPTPTPVVDPIEQYADDALAAMTLRERISSLLMLHYPGTDVAQLREFVTANDLGGMILMGDNIPDLPSDLASMIPQLSDDAGLPILTAIDQEGGIVRRIRTDEFAAASTLRTAPPEAARDAFANRASLLAAAGVSVNLGIVADQTPDTSSFIYSRVLGATPQDAAARVAAAVEGERGTVLSTLKHFPGHGAAPGDSHSSIPSTDLSLDEWRATHALPFESGINAGAELVMFGHLRFTAVDSAPASLSARWHNILRDDLGFDGIVITDDMLMLQDSGEPDFADAGLNAITALAAGNTMLLYVLPADAASVGAAPSHLVDVIEAAVGDGRLSEATIDEAAHRLLIERRELSGQTGPYEG